jgi:hypothetical protein
MLRYYNRLKLYSCDNSCSNLHNVQRLVIKLHENCHPQQKPAIKTSTKDI